MLPLLYVLNLSRLTKRRPKRYRRRFIGPTEHHELLPGLIALTGLKGLPAAAVHFAAIWRTSMVMIPQFQAGPLVTEEDPQTIAIDGLHHAVYALAAGFAYDALE